MAETPASASLDLLRVVIAGSVDDGKSTLIGRLLVDTRTVCADQLEAVADASRRLGESRTNLALLTDGLRAERDQKVTIDVGYRYFATSRRRFIFADTPGHLQYTRNMVTGASRADVAIVLVDATRGVTTQSRRHALLASLLRVPQMVLAVNKMDAVSYRRSVFDAMVGDVNAFAERLEVQKITAIPMSALEGDNVVELSSRMPWYRGASLLDALELAGAGQRVNSVDFRFPVQLVLRPDQTFRGYAGTVASGSVRPGDDIVVLPSGVATRVRSIETFDGARAVAYTGDAVVLTVDSDVDIAAGDMLVRRDRVPATGQRFAANLCWLDPTDLRVGRPYTLMLASRSVQGFVVGVEYRIDVDTAEPTEASTLAMNDIGRVEIATAAPIILDLYRSHPATGCFILVDPQSNATVAAGMIDGGSVSGTGDRLRIETAAVSPDVVWEGWNIPRRAREDRHGHRAGVLWLTGLPAAGKTTIARAVERRLFDEGHLVMLLDGDQLRHGLCGDLGFSPVDRAENIRRAGEVARLFFELGAIVICAFVSPYRADRDRVRELLPAGCFLEVFVTAEAQARRARDPKGHYDRASRGQVPEFTGLSAPYEEPIRPALLVDTTFTPVEATVADVLELLARHGLRKSCAIEPR